MPKKPKSLTHYEMLKKDRKEMLYALKRIAANENFCAMNNGDGCRELTCDFDSCIAEAAIAKAEGRS